MLRLQGDERLVAVEAVYAQQHSGAFADLPALIKAGLMSDEVGDPKAMGYTFRIAIAKDGKMYYAFFAPSAAQWKGEIELRGLKSGKYRLTDYADRKDLGSIAVTANGAVKIQASFNDHLLLEVAPQP